MFAKTQNMFKTRVYGTTFQIYLQNIAIRKQEGSWIKNTKYSGYSPKKNI